MTEQEVEETEETTKEQEVVGEPEEQDEEVVVLGSDEEDSVKTLDMCYNFSGWAVNMVKVHWC